MIVAQDGIFNIYGDSSDYFIDRVLLWGKNKNGVTVGFASGTEGVLRECSDGVFIKLTEKEAKMIEDKFSNHDHDFTGVGAELTYYNTFILP